jgi:hypothetical protein
VFGLVIAFIEHLYTQLVTIALLLIHTLCNSLQHALSLLSLLCLHQSLSDNGFQRLGPSTSPCSLHYWLATVSQLTKFKFKVKVTLRLTVSQSVSKSWCRAPSEAYDQIFITLLTVTVLFFCGAPSLTRGRVCLLYMLLALASAGLSWV